VFPQPVRRGAFALLLGIAGVAAPPDAPAFETRTAPPSARPKLAPGTFLVARRDLPDPNFAETVVLLLGYGPGGALGLVVNRPSDVELSSLAPRIVGFDDRDDPLYIGGPVPGEELYVLVRGDTPPAGAEPVFDGVYASRSPEVLERLAEERIPAGRLRVYAGYAGWAPGQLDNEVERGDWHLLAAEEDSIFTSRPRETWHRLVPPLPTQQAALGTASRRG